MDFMIAMHKLKALFQSPRFPFVTALIVAAAMAGGGALLQQTLHIAACPLLPSPLAASPAGR
ncbi:MAG: hypothetical protein D4S02_18175 [Rhodocyclaceae bacterium]|nr:MAG: hypothetical protein D4S02_18175 [Rhodocyclaceae bacterium]